MKPWIENLLALQAVDVKLRTLNTKLATIPVERKNLEERRAAVLQSVERAKDSLRKIEKAIREEEAQISSIEEQVRKLLVQSSMVKKNNEYQAMMADIEGKKAKISDHETSILELMDQSEEASSAVKKAESSASSEEKQIRMEAKDLDDFEKEIKDELVTTESLRKAHESSVEMKSLEIYNKLIKDKRSLPLAPVEQGGVCGNCRLKVTPQTINDTRKGVLVLCDNCSHMLYMPGTEE